MDSDYKGMIFYEVEPTFDEVFNKDPFDSKTIRYLRIFVDGGIDYSGRGYSSYGDISVVNGYRYGIFNRDKEKNRGRLFYFEK